MDRPPPYFPQNALNPPDERRYRRFKFVVALIVLGLVAVLGGLAYFAYLLISWLSG
ncbi:MAG: hypothetical protein R2684_11040 [Pyrinomonadaceae bacterium]